VLPEGNPEGAALLEAARDNCCGPLSLLPPAGLAHGEGLASAEGRAVLAGVLSEALTELLMLV
jgi:hypothetical protein